jgi:hypothetical protein
MTNKRNLLVSFKKRKIEYELFVEFQIIKILKRSSLNATILIWFEESFYRKTFDRNGYLTENHLTDRFFGQTFVELNSHFSSTKTNPRTNFNLMIYFSQFLLFSYKITNI